MSDEGRRELEARKDLIQDRRGEGLVREVNPTSARNGGPAARRQNLSGDDFGVVGVVPSAYRLPRQWYTLHIVPALVSVQRGDATAGRFRRQRGQQSLLG